jgi:hypothetical protein
MSTTHGDDDDFVPRKIVDPNDIGFNFAQVMQWVALHPDIPHTAFRVYCVLRALYTHKRDLRSISKDQLRFMIPGVNGKPMSMTVLNDALKVLAEFELVTNPDGKRHTWRLREPGTNRFVARTEWTFQLGQLPPEGDGFTGWRNVFDKHDAYPGPGWDKKPQVTSATENPVEDLPLAAGDSLSQGSAGRGHNRNSGRVDRNSETRDRNSGGRNRNSGRAKAVARANPAPNNSLEEPLQEPGGRDAAPQAPASRNRNSPKQVVTDQPTLRTQPQTARVPARESVVSRDFESWDTVELRRERERLTEAKDHLASHDLFELERRLVSVNRVLRARPDFQLVDGVEDVTDPQELTLMPPVPRQQRSRSRH